MHRIPNLLKSRHGVFYLRLWRDGKERRISLGTKDWSKAKLMACQFHLAGGHVVDIKKLDIVFPSGAQFREVNTDDDLRRIKELVADGKMAEALGITQKSIQDAVRQLGMSPDAFSSPTAHLPPTVKARTKPFAEVVELYLTEKKLNNVQKTLDEKRSTYDEFARLFGAPDMGSLGDEQAIAFKTRMVAEGLKALRINKKLSFMKDLFGYAIAHKMYFAANPFTDLPVSKKGKVKAEIESYEQFTDDELKLIFENEDYAVFMNKPDYHWLPFLALYTGARIESLASLTVRQIVKDGDIWFFDITRDKNANSIRKIPLHERILESAFLKYVDAVRDAGHTQLFPHIKPGKNGYSRNCSRRFGEYLDKLGIKDGRKVFHSFRVTFINCMTDINTHPALLMGLVGHYEQSKVDLSSTHMQTYQKVKRLEVLKCAMDRLEYDLQFAAH